jgi:hypothetical protein
MDCVFCVGVSQLENILLESQKIVEVLFRKNLLILNWKKKTIGNIKIS